MITQNPKDWKDLQDKVDFIFKSVGLKSEKEKTIYTPRGTIEIDVFAIDPLSLDRIKYLVECKNWKNKVPQTVVHGFTLVMQETGGNIGYIISRVGFQKGAINFSKSTNIRLFSFDEFQKHYFENWYRIFFSTEIGKASSELIQYIEPMNSRRFKYEGRLDGGQKLKFEASLKKYNSFANLLLQIGSQLYKKSENISKNGNIFSLTEIESEIFDCFGINYRFECYSDALELIKLLIARSVQEFVDIFGENIFQDHNDGT